LREDSSGCKFPPSLHDPVLLRVEISLLSACCFLLRLISTLNTETGTVFNSNIEILQRFQSKTLRSILNPPRYINNHRIHEDLHMNTVLSEIKKWNTKYLRNLENHTNALAVNLLDNSETTRRLKRYTVLTLPALSKTPK
jgi:hypothetical protein